MPVGTCSPYVEFGVGTMAAGLCVHGGSCTGLSLKGSAALAVTNSKEEERSDGSMASSCS